MQLKASAPGSLMLLGEFAVLHGKSALVCAVDKRLTVTLTPRLDKKIQIESSLGFFSTTISNLSNLKIEKPFQFLLAALKTYQSKLHFGCDIKIESEFSHAIGFGSSAAITVATLSALAAWLNIKVSSLTLLKQARRVVRSVQGRGSGADVAASVYGGIISYTASPLIVKKFSEVYPLTILYSGFKTPTVEVIKKIENQFMNSPKIYKKICDGIGECSKHGSQAVKKNDWKSLGKIMNVQQGLMQALGVNLPLLQEMTEDLLSHSEILGAKISGSGLGDCVVGLGEFENKKNNKIKNENPKNKNEKNEFKNNESEKNNKVKRIQAAMTLQGVKCEKI